MSRVRTRPTRDDTREKLFEAAPGRKKLLLIEGGTHNDWTAWETGRYPDGTPHVVDGATAARAAASNSFSRVSSLVGLVRTLDIRQV